MLPRLVLLVLLIICLAASVQAATGYALIVAGAPHDTRHRNWYWGATSGMYDVLVNRYHYTAANIYFYFSDTASGDARVDGVGAKANVQNALATLAGKLHANDTLFCYFVGHGTYSGGKSSFEFTNGAVTDATINLWRAGIASPIQTWCFSQCNSGHFAVALSSPGTVVLTSVRANEGNREAWAEPIRDALNNVAGSDANGDGKVSFAEAFNYARAQVISKYGASPLAEHSQLEDTGDGQATENAAPSGAEGHTAIARFLGATPAPWLQAKVARYSDGQQITYAQALPSGPVILCSAQKTGAPLMACAVNNSPTGFRLALKDHAGAAVLGAWVQWLAVVPQPWFQSGVARYPTNTRINFSRALPGAPLVLTNAQLNMKPMAAAATSVSGTGFTLKLLDQAGNPPASPWVQWIAFSLPRAFRGGVIASAGNQQVTWTPPLPVGDVILTCAQKAGAPLLSGAIDNSPTGFGLRLLDVNGISQLGASATWLAFTP